MGNFPSWDGNATMWYQRKILVNFLVMRMLQGGNETHVGGWVHYRVVSKMYLASLMKRGCYNVVLETKVQYLAYMGNR
jgi:hypothetical protein